MILLTRRPYAGGLRGGLTRGLREKADASLRGAYAELTRLAYATRLRKRLSRKVRFHISSGAYAEGRGFRTALIFRHLFRTTVAAGSVGPRDSEPFPEDRKSEHWVPWILGSVENLFFSAK